MHEHGQSDRPGVPANPSNKAVEAVAEMGEERGPAKGNTDSKRTPDTVPDPMRPVRWAVCVR